MYLFMLCSCVSFRKRMTSRTTVVHANNSLVKEMTVQSGKKKHSTSIYIDI